MASRQQSRPATAVAARYGPVALVTGASDGIGRACAERLAAAGFALVLVARRQAELDSLADRLRARHGIVCHVLAADLGTSAGISATCEAAASHDIGLFVAAAGFGTAGPFLANDIETELAMIDVNCRAVVALTHALAAQMRGRAGRRSAIVLLSSLVGFQGVPRAANYAATKGFIQVLAEGLRLELAGDGIDVLAVAPGPVKSGFAARAGMTMGLADTPDAVARGIVASLGHAGTVRPGWLAKGLEFALMPLPRRGRTLILQQVMAGMTR
ncbi:SDR family NAD(P)-dependent oxidoreductase [Sandarakinorhabdus rubra]|uniref:SDR family NAD(P)-dependent oxidoreductase n=1 Tax=Sandarakinorhabdus rubra TaxID=2672568 RepID=UPI0013D9B7BB|nr:SDR family NAD(P)-dependent oxidoreductase [Sandarakinorhabdus rubra]